MKWDLPKESDDPAIARKVAKDANGELLHVHDIVRLADHVREIEGFSLLAKKLKTTRGMIDEILRNDYVLIDFPGTVFRQMLLNAVDLKFISHKDWNAEEPKK